MKKLLFMLLSLIMLTCACHSAPPLPADKLAIIRSSGTLNVMYSYPGYFGYFNDGMIIVVDSSGKRIVLNTQGETAITIPENIVINGEFSEGFLVVVDKKTRLAGFMDTSGEIILPCQYNAAAAFHDGLAYIEFTDGERGYIDKKGNVIVKGLPYGTEYFGEEDASFSEGLAQFSGEGGIGFIDKQGDIVIEPAYRYAYPFYDGLALVVNADELHGYIDKDGETAIPCQYLSAGLFDGGFAPVTTQEGVCGIINKKGELVSTHPYKNSGRFSNGLLKVTNEEGRIGYVDTSSNLAIPFGQYTWGTSFSEGVALVGIESDGRTLCGYIDRQGVLLTELKYNILSRDFREGYALAVMDHENYATEILQIVRTK